MIVIGGVTFLALLQMLGISFIFLSSIGLIICHYYKKKTGHAVKLWIKVLFWIILIAGIAALIISAMYFYLIATNW